MKRCPRCDHFNSDETPRCERCDTALTGSVDPEMAPSKTGPAGLEAEVVSIDQTGGKIAAIKRYRQATGCDLKAVKEAVEALMWRHNVAAAGSECTGILVALALLAGGGSLLNAALP